MKTDKTALTSIILETRKTNAKSLHPVKLRVTFNKDRKYYTLKGLNKKTVYMLQDDFDKISTDNKFKRLKIHLGAIEKSEMDAIKEINVFSFATLEAIFFSKRKDDSDLFSIMTAT